jgi:hypothetical protein
MTAVYLPVPVEGSEICQPVAHEDYDQLAIQLNGEIRKDTWKPIPVRILKSNQGRPLAYSDSPWMTAHGLVFRETALVHMRTEIQGEFLPLSCDEGALVVLNSISVAEALDEAASTIKRFKSGKIMDIQRHTFRPRHIAKLNTFRIPNYQVSPIFVSDHFVRRWQTANLKGLSFQKIWEYV